jgi:transposase-like protein
VPSSCETLVEASASPPSTTGRRLYGTAPWEKTLRPGGDVRHWTVARKYGVSPSVLFRWRQLRESGALVSLKADEELVPASEMKAARTKVRELQRLLGKKTEEVEILKEGLVGNVACLQAAFPRVGWHGVQGRCERPAISRTSS